jgi:hypothetical protein
MQIAIMLRSIICHSKLYSIVISLLSKPQIVSQINDNRDKILQGFLHVPLVNYSSSFGSR